MTDINLFDISAFPLDRLIKLKGDIAVIVVLPTLGERESDLIADKLAMLSSLTGSVVDHIFLAHRKLSPSSSPDRTEQAASAAPCPVTVINCAEVTGIPDMDMEPGKGADMRRALFEISKMPDITESCADPVVVFLDSDSDNSFFSPDYAVSLACAVLSGFDFAKAGFWRRSGRVKKFTAQPLFSVIDHPLINKLTGLSYPLSGECAARMSFFNSVHFFQKFGVETSMLIDACAGGSKIADINFGLYDHGHSGDADVQKISFGVIRAFLMRLEMMGIISFNNGARISDIFRLISIDENGTPGADELNMAEKIYEPLASLLR
jgi:glucosyl-3-phosphoglycerate synthase